MNAGQSQVKTESQKTHRRQEDRSRQMKARLIEATLVCLQKYGYHGSSLSVILKEAGASRGAWSHHYRSKKDLVAEAAESILNYAIERAQEAASSLKRGGSFQAILDFIWDNFYTGRHRDVWLEFNNAARTDAELKERLLPILEKFHASLDRLWTDHLLTGDHGPDARTLMNLTIYLLRGMAIQSVSYERPEYYAELRQEWAQLMEKQIHWK